MAHAKVKILSGMDFTFDLACAVMGSLMLIEKNERR